MYYVGSAPAASGKLQMWFRNLRAITLAQERSCFDAHQPGSFDAVRGEVIIRGYTGATTVNAGVLFQNIKTSTGEVVSVWDDTDIVH